jgi:threonine aldolase
LYELVGDIKSLQLSPPQVNSMYPILAPEVKTQLQEWSFFWDWDEERSQVRWMTSWDTTPEDVEAFAAGIRAQVA